MRFVEDGGWFADCPIVLDFDGVRVEIFHWQFDELSIGWRSSGDDLADGTLAVELVG